MRSRCWARATSSRCAASVSSRAARPSALVTSPRRAISAASPLGARGLGGTPRPAARPANVERRESAPRGRRRPSRAACGLPARRTARDARAAARSRSAAAARSSDSARPATARTRSSPVRTASRASVSFARAAVASAAAASRTVTGLARSDSDSVGSASARCSRSASSVSSRWSPASRWWAAAECRRGRSASARADLATEPRWPELLGDRGERGVGLVQPVERAPRDGPAPRLDGAEPHQREPGALPRGDRVRHRGPRLRRAPPAARAARARRSTRPRRAPRRAGPRRRVTATRSGRSYTRARAWARSSTTTTCASSRRDGATRRSRAGSHQLDSGARTGGRPGPCDSGPDASEPTSSEARPPSSSRSRRRASTAASTEATATASASGPRAAVMASS